MDKERVQQIVDTLVEVIVAIRQNTSQLDTISELLLAIQTQLRNNQ